MCRTTRFVTAGLTLVLGLTALPVLAAEGRIPIWQPVQIFPGGEGKYILTRDVMANAAQPVAIDILPGTVAVDIDLNGFTIYGLANVIQAVGVDSLTVRNGTIMGSNGDGIHAMECRKVVIEDVKLQFTQGYGIALLNVQNFAVRRNIIVQTGNEGIYVDGTWVDPFTVVDGTIEGNLIRECFRGVTLYYGSSVAITDNRIEATFGDGIFISPGPHDVDSGCVACLIRENTIEEAQGNGMWLSYFEGGKVHNNAVTRSQAEGIWLDWMSRDNLLLDNVVTRSGSNGLIIQSDFNHVERNVLNENGWMGGGWGLFFSQGAVGNTYRGNTAQGNPGPPAACPGFPATTDFCDASGGANTSPFAAVGLGGDNLMPGPL
jgi:nitrous oxidase accessory protein NosD